MMIKDIKTKAIAMDQLIKDISIKHPLTASQLSSLRAAVISYTLPVNESSESTNEQEVQPPPPPSEPSDNAMLASLFGWNLVSPSLPEPPRRVSLSRANSSVPSVPASPALSRASSVSLPQTPPPKRPRQSISTDIALRLPINLNKAENALLQCDLCQRRIGLWAFSLRSTEDDANMNIGSPSSQQASDDVNNTPGPVSRPKKPLPRRSLDLLKEHRSYCPYVVRSTVVPTFPNSQTPSTPGKSSVASSNGHGSSLSLSQFNSRNGVPGALEGWRAVLTVVLRYGMVQKQRIEYSFLAPKDSTEESGDNSDKMDVDNVKAMVTGVKTRGGKDLLKYVKGLLG
ncbi:hypothetical protein JR316_0006001 [Psilocybe cubensis]|nr:hypothetical protein JR316_0006001 [Psilocybe cubensis]KAH9481474.1 hypothetical protein JR316_0006001 [Psilocybe cubensis]